MELNREHFRAIIYYNFQRRVLLQQECLVELLFVFGNEAPHQSTISRWYGEFKRGRVSLSDDSRLGAPKTAVTQENVGAVRKLIIEDRHVAYREIEASLKISKTSFQKILHEELRVRKFVSRWIPHLLTEEQKAARVNWCQKTLNRFNSRNSKNVYSIVSGDESWIYCYEPQNKRQSAVWVFQGEEKPTKIIRSRSVSKNMYLTEENVELLDHPPYSPDLTPNDFFTFPKIKNRLREEAVDAFKNAMCINLRGEYFEKQ
ncbi:unnamed protein product [Acanthoscelides obtectus]|uniref:Mos1 transposase HTH domain-containing protein n=1 Tax=Acanthoscelides obtectus TaxID=200917 RepID=A0A9P0Q3N0_ACAOB|nr:unnamed protein product [Acanthoscelides obtectus]CAK1645885.1 Mariner Mos1 transposase [Acanthoscelides obtectus]